jgi:hypothetical protein
MSTAPLIHVVQERLHRAGYQDLSIPLRVAGVEFAFTGAMRGREGRALDLVLLVDTTTGEFGDRDGARVRQRVEALSRALDVTASRYVVTLILAGAALAEGVEALSETCRVLQVESIALNQAGQPVDESAQRQLDDRIRVLLPLTLPLAPMDPDTGSGPAIDQLIRVLTQGTEKAFLDAVVDASAAGEAAVTEAVARAVGEQLQGLSKGQPS